MAELDFRCSPVVAMLKRLRAAPWSTAVGSGADRPELNRYPEAGSAGGGTVTIEISKIGRRLRDAAAKVVPAQEAAYFADLVLEAHLRKAPRMNPLEDAVTEIKVWADAGGRTPGIEVDREGVLILDFKGLAPTLKLKYIRDELERRARQNGLAAVGFRNSSGVIVMNPWSEGLARRDLIGVAMFNGGTRCAVPYGGTLGVFGTLPLAYAVPTADKPLILDMAMSEIPFFRVDNAKKTGEALPEGSAVDRHGLPTTDAAVALGDDGVANLLPLGGGFKGYGLLMLMEILTGSLVRSLLSTRQTPGWYPPEYGGFVCAIDIASFTDPDRFKREVGEMCTEIRRQRPAEGHGEVAVPGDRGHRKAAAARRAGRIEIKDQVAEDLLKLAS
jgi:LDH2 family malate/lactate/ureidoglycolate dehydrogenase